MEKVKALCSKLRKQLDDHKGIQAIEMFELLELVVNNLPKPKVFHIDIDTLVKEVNMKVPTTKKAEKELSKIINDRIFEVLKDISKLQESDFYTRYDMISFATYIYGYVPGQHPDKNQLKQWEVQK